MIRENQSFDIPNVLELNEGHRDDLLEAIEEIKRMQQDIISCGPYDRMKKQKLQLKKKFLQKKVDEYNKLNKGFELFF